MTEAGPLLQRLSERIAWEGLLNWNRTTEE
jgi:hypothetical protein